LTTPRNLIPCPPTTTNTSTRTSRGGEDEREFGAFPNALHAGEKAPDGELTRLGGERVRLSELWRRTGLVLEFGSFT